MTARKRTQKVKKPLIKRELIQPLFQQEMPYFNGLVEISNGFGKIKKQFDQYQYIKTNLEVRRYKIQSGEIKMPILIQLSQDMYYNESNKKLALAKIDEQLKGINNALLGIKSQLDARREAFIEQGLRLFQWAQGRFGPYKAVDFTPRKILDVDKKAAEKEIDTLFKADVKDLKNPKVMAEFNKAKAIAIKKNKELK